MTRHSPKYLIPLDRIPQGRELLRLWQRGVNSKLER